MASTYTPIATYTATGSISSITFSSIPSTYTDLVIVVNGQAPAAGNVVTVRYNGDSGTNYSMTELYGTGSTAASYRRTSVTSYETSYNEVNFPNNSPGVVIINVMNYANTTTYKTALSRVTSPTATYPGTAASVGLWRSTSAINQIVLGCSLNTGATATIYGIASA